MRINSGKHAEAAAAEAARVPSTGWRDRLPILRLALVMLVFDFSAYLIRPFFSVYWQQVSGLDSEFVSGIPGVVAIVALRLHARIRARGGQLPDHTVGNLLLGMVGLLLHAAPNPALIVLGRVLYGWALFQIIVKLEVNLFRLSTPQRYAHDYSITNFFQNMGLLAAGGFVLTALLDRLILNVPSAGHADDAGRADAPANLEAPAHAN